MPHRSAFSTVPFLILYKNFVNEAEEQALLAELEPLLAARKYENTHWDAVISGYRELERARFGPAARKIITKCVRVLPTRKIMPIHILDLHQNGRILAHVDSVTSSGPLLAGLCLLSDCVMQLTEDANRTSGARIEVLLPRRSFYVYSSAARYQFAHAIPTEQVFKGKHIIRNRRISLMFRDPGALGETYSQGNH